MANNKKMEHVFFLPFVGKNYETEGFQGIRLLVLGESHYCKYKTTCTDCNKEAHSKCSNFTREKVSNFLNYKNGEEKFDYWMRTFTKFTNVLFGEQIGNKTLVDFWESIVFYNYVQFAIEESRTPPTDQQFQDSEQAFFEVLDEYKPDLIIVWGTGKNRLWNQLPKSGRWGTDHILGKESERFYYYKAGNKEIPACGIYHPSSQKFTYDEYSEYLKEAIRMVKESK